MTPVTYTAVVTCLCSGQIAQIRLPHAGCTGNCAGCSACSADPDVAYAENPIGAQPGQRVVVERLTVRKPPVYRYLIPLLLFLAGFLLAVSRTDQVALRYAAGGVGFLAGLLPLICAGRRKTPAYRIVRLF